MVTTASATTNSEERRDIREHDRITQQLHSVRKFSPDWFRLKEELVAIGPRLPVELEVNKKSTTNRSPGPGFGPVFVHDCESDGEDDDGVPLFEDVDEDVVGHAVTPLIDTNHSKPLEITSRRALGSSRGTETEDTLPEIWSDLLHEEQHPDNSLYRTRRRNRFTRFLGRCRGKHRLLKIIFTTLLIFAIVVSFVTMKGTNSKSNNESKETEYSKDDVEDINDDIDPEPNPPIFPDSMKLFHPPQSFADIEEMRKTLEEYSDPIIKWEDHSSGNENEPNPDGYPDFTYTSANHFTSRRTALLFTPGTYPNLDFEIGYYTSVIGLGTKPTNVQFTDCAKGPHVPALEKYTNRPPNGSGLDTFWRSIENIATDANEGMQWTVSQAAPLRRMHIQTDLNLFDGDSWVSGGVAANIIVDGKVNFGGQQQWLMRNVELKDNAVNGAWSLVYVGCTGKVPEENSGMSGGPSISVEDKPRVRVEKPYIVMKTVGSSLTDRSTRQTNQYQLELHVPRPTFGDDASGPQFDIGKEDIRDFRRVKLAVPSNSTDIATAAKENYSVLQKALNEEKDLVLSPGIYYLSNTLKLSTENQVVLGLGYATLVAPPDGSPCISVHSWVPGVRIAGIMLEASVLSGTKKRETSSLLEWGTQHSTDAGDATNPGVLTDIYARVGGLSSRDASTDVMIRIHSGNIYGDNLWLWRADHVKLQPDEEPNFPQISLKYRQTVKGECEVKNGLVVDSGANDVTMVGLAVEHTSEDQTIWEGENGEVYFYQSELPYDADQTFADEKFVGYKVDEKVTTHRAVGLGVYSNFRDHGIVVKTGIVHPVSDDIEMRNLFTVKLDNKGKINSVVNGRGPGPVDDTERGHPHRCANQIC